MGRRPSAGYSINIKKTKIKGFDVAIYVSEKEPGKGEMVDVVLTYPIVQIKFNSYPHRIEVFNYDNGEEYPRLNIEK